MSPEEIRQAGHDPDRERYVSSNRWRRELSIQQAYLLRDKLNKARTDEEREAVLLDWAEAAGRDVDALRAEARWTDAIKEKDLRDAFAAEGIKDELWQARLGTGHIKAVAPAKEQNTKRALTSEEKAAILVEAYHANWKVAELTKALQDRGLKGKRPGMKSDPTKNLTACTLLTVMAQDLQKRGIDIDLGLLPEKWGEPSKVSAILWKLSSRFNQLYPNAEYAPKVEGSTQERKES